ncbi:TRAP transporter large permease subunit [Bacillus sp. Marseille-P3661]|uniref:TRAP transporter large permease subunit n=1 Tax=Bacillus sp. Marseille-P3661 TaxID=1936234 RepID=UPI00115A649B|nr:TRAP transporter large permease subunit [Bacillus sp. Marseille-P3661]
MKVLTNYSLLAVVLYYLSGFSFHAIYEKLLLFFLLMAIILGLVLFSKRVPKILGITLFLIGHILFFYFNLSLDDWLHALEVNIGIVSIFIAVSILQIPVQFRNYMDEVTNLSNKYLTTANKKYLFLSTLTFCFTPLFNISVLRFLEPYFVRINTSSQLIGASILRSFGASFLWAPTTGAMVIVTTGLQDLSYTRMFAYALTAAILMVGIGGILNFFLHKNLQWDKNSLEAPSPVKWSIIIELMSIFFAMIIFTLTLDAMFHFEIPVIVVTAVLITTVLWVVYLKRWTSFTKEIKQLPQNLSMVYNEALLFLSAGFFSYVLSRTPMGKAIQEWLFTLIDINVYILILTLILSVLILSMVGIHQSVLVTVVAINVDPAFLGIDPLILALILLYSWSLGTVLSPLSPTNIVLADLLHKNPFRTGLQWNFKYGLLTLLFFLIYVAILDKIL